MRRDFNFSSIIMNEKFKVELKLFIQLKKNIYIFLKR